VEEPELIARARGGDEDAFGQLVTLHADRVYGLLRRFGLGPSDAEEVAQEVFLRAWRGLSRFEARAQLATWLYRIAFNEAQRRLAGQAPAALQPDADHSDPVLLIPDAPSSRPGAQALDREFHEHLTAALGLLPAELRAAVVLRDLEGFSTRAAADIAGVRQAAFKSRLHRGRMQLRGLLEPYLGLEET
jgi:RNA polymerase sigma-70 factor (ECF subfamily)